MSYRLEYQYAVFIDDSAATRRYVVAIEGGDNNCYEGRSGRRSRSWDAAMIGTESSVLKQAVDFAAACPGGSLKPMGQDCTPESYIARIRRLLATATDRPSAGYWSPDVRLPKGHAAAGFARSLGLPTSDAMSYGRPIERVEISRDRRNLIFDIAESFPDLPAWTLAAVGGLPSS